MSDDRCQACGHSEAEHGCCPAGQYCLRNGCYCADGVLHERPSKRLLTALSAAQSSDALVAAAYLDAAECVEGSWSDVSEKGTCDYAKQVILTRTPADAQAALEALKLEIRKQAFEEATTHWPDFSSAAGWECSCGCKVVGKAGWQEHIRSLASAPAVNEYPEKKL